MSALDAKYDQVATALQHERAESSHNHHSRSEGSVESSNPRKGGSIPTRMLRLDFPCFSGYDSHGWVHWAEQFFSYHNTDLEQCMILFFLVKKCMIIVSFHLEGEAQQWFRWTEKVHGSLSRLELSEGIKKIWSNLIRRLLGILV